MKWLKLRQIFPDNHFPSIPQGRHREDLQIERSDVLLRWTQKLSQISRSNSLIDTSSALPFPIGRLFIVPSAITFSVIKPILIGPVNLPSPSDFQIWDRDWVPDLGRCSPMFRALLIHSSLSECFPLMVEELQVTENDEVLWFVKYGLREGNESNLIHFSVSNCVQFKERWSPRDVEKTRKASEGDSISGKMNSMDL
jgi:hypothetical protein